MQLCRVVGSTVSTVKAPGLAAFKLLNVTPEKSEGPEFVAVDGVGAGEGDLVLVATGSAARELEATRGLAVDATVIAIVDPARRP
ncbi:MAG: EutN/CcmL family microcompartment protein [Thermoleophilia bacterium]|nr:EutN/CcmL family microcompartment protein [Thermoleophilia bacterium]